MNDLQSILLIVAIALVVLWIILAYQVLRVVLEVRRIVRKINTFVENFKRKISKRL